MTPAVAWYLNQLDTHGLVLVLAVQGGLILAICCGPGAVWTAIERLRDRRHIRREIHHLEHYANHPANRRREDTP